MTAQPHRPAFGTVLTSHMAVATYQAGGWSRSEITPVAPIELSPAAHVLHYASTCFEGFKAFRRADGSIHIFRMDRHIQRMRQSARSLVLPEPDPVQLAEMVRAVINRCRDAVPEAPGALYLRPILFGTTREYRCGGDAHGGRLADRAGKPGVGLLFRRREAAAHSDR